MKDLQGREASLLCLLDIEKGKNLEDIEESLRKSWKDRREEHFFRYLTYGVLKEEGLLIEVLRPYLRQGLRKLHAPMRWILLQAIYQFLEMKKIPSRAVVSEAVALAKRFGHGKSGGFVNAVLRNMIRDGVVEKDVASIRQSLLKNKDEPSIAQAFSVPEFYVKDLLSQFAQEEVISILQASKMHPTLYARVNTLKTTSEKLLADHKELFDRGQLFEYSLEIRNLPALLESDLFSNGDVYIQDESSMAVADFAKPEGTMKILDVCAAPGGKSFSMAMLAPDATILAQDVSKKRLKRMEENAKRLGLSLRMRCADGREESGESFDLVVVDAPCSGFGLIGKKPDIARHRTEEQIQELAKLQEEILEASWQSVARGGRLVYSTCTLTRCENEEVIEGFLSRHQDARLETWNVALPHTDHGDGFKMARLHKEA